MIKKKYTISGQAAISTVLLICGIIFLIVITLIITMSSYSISVYGFLNSSRALAAANGGADDALIQLTRNKSFEDINGYIINVDGINVTVTVQQNFPSSGRALIVSSADLLGYNKKIKIIVSISDEGEVRIVSRQQT